MHTCSIYFSVVLVRQYTFWRSLDLYKLISPAFGLTGGRLFAAHSGGSSRSFTTSNITKRLVDT